MSRISIDNCIQTTSLDPATMATGQYELIIIFHLQNSLYIKRTDFKKMIERTILLILLFTVFFKVYCTFFTQSSNYFKGQIDKQYTYIDFIKQF